MKKKRIFISLNVSESIKDKIAKAQKHFVDFKGVKWELRKKLHITLYFLGYLGNEEIEKLKDVLLKIRFECFRAELSDCDFFPNEKNPRVVVFNIDSNNKIEDLQKMIGEELSKYIFFKPEKRKYKAHLTFGRINKISNSQINLIKKRKVSGFWIITEINLMQSILKRTGSEYKVLEKYKLWKK
ncbi:MAG: RNA 2',3'-cyclic phosphodiesterase [Patescibacteria group bacterium]|nr:RNA 2',3'-cyclic phosphodiesterase [Patescibacteria group bacterium]